MLKKIWTKLDRIPKRGVGFLEWLMFAAIAVASYVFFCHQDILITAGHAAEYLHGHITNFYSACKATDGTYGANYLPTTFLIFAVWNIPMKLLGLLPEYVGDWSVPFTMWNKLLPTIAFMLSGYVMYRLVTDRLKFDKSKGMLTVFLFFTTPMAFFSQFFFCQYDIFTVFFMLLGMYFFFKEKPKKKDYLLFALSFGIATTFKYFALLIFVILLLLRVKNVWKVICAAIPAALPLAVEVLFYLIFDRKAFMKSVFGFGALDNASGFIINIGGMGINALYLVLLVIIACSYFTKPKDFDEYISYGMFYSCGICFALFGLMVWYPQWLLFMAPFWVISTVINKHYEIFFWIDTLLGLVLDIYIVNVFVNSVDQSLLRFGIFHDELQYSMNAATKMRDFFVYQDTTMLFTIISAIFLIGFVFKHPKFNFEKINENLKKGRFIINVRFLAFSCAFMVGALACLPSFLESPDIVWERFGGYKQQIVTINNKTKAEEYTTLDAEMIQTVYVVCDEYKETKKKAKIIVDIIDTETNEVVATGSRKEKNIADGSHNFTKIVLDEKFYPEKDKEYCFRFYTDSSKKVAIYFEKSSKEKASYYKTYQKDYSDCYSKYKGKEVKNKDIVMRLVGEAE